jgi:hypothetical protein
VDVHIENLQATVRAVDDRTLLSPDVLEAVVTEVMARWERRARSAAQARDEARIWPSVRARDTA